LNRLCGRGLQHLSGLPGWRIAGGRGICSPWKGLEGTMIPLLLIPVLVVILAGLVPVWPYNRKWGYYPTGGLGAILVMFVTLMLLGKI